MSDLALGSVAMSPRVYVYPASGRVSGSSNVSRGDIDNQQ